MYSYWNANWVAIAVCDSDFRMSIVIHRGNTLNNPFIDSIISMIIPEYPAALPDLILTIALDTISDVILIAGHGTGASSRIFAAVHLNSTFKSF